MKHLIMVIAFDLERDENQEVKVGQGTEEACLHAIQLHKKNLSGSVIVVTAGYSGKYKRYMSDVMKKYILNILPKASVISCDAERFNTSGEMEALSEIAIARCGHSSRGNIIIVTKWWHAPRCFWLCHYWLIRNRAWLNYKVRIKTHCIDVPTKTIMKEFFVAIPSNFIRGFIPTIKWIIGK